MGLISTHLRLYLVTDPQLCAAHGVENTVRAAVRGGVTIVQLRDKHANTTELVALGRALLAALHDTGVPLIINDDVDAALAIGAHGVHVGQSDQSPSVARARLGPNAIVGLSCETVKHAQQADPAILDYVGLGPVFDTATKPDHAAAMGLESLRIARAATPLPAVAIGGIHRSRVADVLTTGVDGIAVVSAVCGQPDVEAAARALRDDIDACFDDMSRSQS